jgi:hypothetical protein
MSNKKGCLALALALACIPAAAIAGPQNENKQLTGWFAGLGYAQADATMDVLGYSVKWKSDLTSLDGGYRWAVGSTSAIGVELGVGNTGYRFTMNGLGTIESGNATHAFVGLNGRTHLGQSPAFVLYRVGSYSESFRMEGTTYSTDAALYAGIGIGADLNPHFNIQASYLHLSGSGGDPDRNAVQLGLEYRF